MDISNLEEPGAESGLIETVSRFDGGSAETTQKTLNAAIPTIMYAIADQGSSEVGARGLLDGLNSGLAPQLELPGLAPTLDNPVASDRTMAASGAFLERLFGGRLSGVLGE